MNELMKKKLTLESESGLMKYKPVLERRELRGRKVNDLMKKKNLHWKVIVDQ